MDGVVFEWREAYHKRRARLVFARILEPRFEDLAGGRRVERAPHVAAAHAAFAQARLGRDRREPLVNQDHRDTEAAFEPVGKAAREAAYLMLGAVGVHRQAD